MPHLSFQLKAFLMLANVSISIFSLLDNCNFSISHILTVTIEAYVPIIYLFIFK